MNTSESRNEDVRESGALTVQTLTAGGALPLVGAVVTISDAGDGNLSEDIILISGDGGLTARQSLPTPPKSLSQTPSVIPPYAVYDILVTHPNYYPFNAKNVPIFSGVNSFQTVKMIPLAPYDRENTVPILPVEIVERENSLLLDDGTQNGDGEND